MKWRVVLTPEFEQDFRGIYDYVYGVLLVPDTAKRIAKKLLAAVEKLDEMPCRFSVVDVEPWKSRGLRKMPVDNFVVFYYPNEIVREVVIFHVFYGGRSFDELL